MNPTSRPRPRVHYRIAPADPHAHVFTVQLHVRAPGGERLRVAMPAWIPGSYMIRDFARHVIAIEARDSRGAIGIEKVDKHTWECAPAAGTLVVDYRVYAWDLSVRGAHLDATHAFFNGTSVFLRVLGLEDEPCGVEIARPPSPIGRDWQVATTLEPDGAPSWGFGRYRASDYDDLVDHPVEMGRFDRIGFEAGGADHDLVVTGRHDADLERIARDLAPVCSVQARLFDPRGGRAPMTRYAFLLTVVDDGYGGLEHRASTALLCNRNDLPARAAAAGPPDDGYRRFLGLASHEYFHTWHVKRIKPAAFADYDLDREVYSRLLWVFEGFTSYYDDLMLRRAGVIAEADYLRTLASTISLVARAPGRHVQSVAESSFDAWTKYYRQDENAPNAIVSYYAKGALVALAIDLELRARSAGSRSLDDVMRWMWREYGRDFASRRHGVEEDAMPAIVRAATGVDLDRRIRDWTQGTRDIPLARLLARVGLRLTFEAPDKDQPWLGIRSAERDGTVRVSACLRDGPAARAGLSAGDLLVAVDGLRVDSERKLRGMLARRQPGDTMRLHVFRRDELVELLVQVAAPPKTEARIVPVDDCPADAARLRAKWLKVLSPRTSRASARGKSPSP